MHQNNHQKYEAREFPQNQHKKGLKKKSMEKTRNKLKKKQINQFKNE